MNTYERVYELLLEEAFLLEQRKPLSWKQKLGAGLLGTAALFGAGKGMQGTSTAKATPTPVTAPAKGIKFKTDYERGGGMRKTTPKPKNPFGSVPRWAHTDDKGKAVKEIPRTSMFGASLAWQAAQPNREKFSRAIRGENPNMPKRRSGEIGPPEEPSFKAKIATTAARGYKQIKAASHAAQDQAAMVQNYKRTLGKAKGLSAKFKDLGTRVQQGELHLVSKGLVPPPGFFPKGTSDRPPLELLSKQRGPKRISALSRPGKTDTGETGYPNLTISAGGHMDATDQLPKQAKDKPSILDPGSKAQREYLRYRDAAKPKKKK